MRGAYTSAESVQDIEAIRAALGYEKLVLYGTSYGTKVALKYAERYPEHVEAMVLDSVVPPEGPEPFALDTFQALGSVLGELCSEGACAHITANPLTDLATLATRLRKHPLSGTVYDGSGHRHGASLDEPALLAILEAGDLNPALRALLPAAAQSALHGEPDPLLRLRLLSEGLIPNVPVPPRPSLRRGSGRGGRRALPGNLLRREALPVAAPRAPRDPRNGSPRRAERGAGLRLLPLRRGHRVGDSMVPDCVAWPYASPAPPLAGTLPNVPTLILSGAQDLRTPTANARAVAARIPDTQLLVVPYTGHSVLGTDLSNCAENAVSAFFAGAAVSRASRQPTSSALPPRPHAPGRRAARARPRGQPGARSLPCSTRSWTSCAR